MSLLRSFSLPGSGAGSEINELLHSRACASSIHFAGTKYWISSSSLVRSVSDDDEEDAQQQPVTDSDTVMDEVDRWSKLDKVTIKEFRDDAGIVNEFALLYKLRGAFPLHYTVFKQTAAHIPHEGNSEQLFSRSGALSDTATARWTRRGWQSGRPSASTTRPSSRATSRFLSGISSSLAPAAKLPTCMKTTSDCLMQTASKVRRPQAERCMSRPLMGSERGEQQSQLQAMPGTRRAPVVGARHHIQGVHLGASFLNGIREC
jgi:hypothetical protein